MSQVPRWGQALEEAIKDVKREREEGGARPGGENFGTKRKGSGRQEEKKGIAAN